MRLVRAISSLAFLGLVVLAACDQATEAPPAVLTQQQPVQPAPKDERCDDECQLRIQGEVAEHRKKLDARPFTWGQ